MREDQIRIAIENLPGETFERFAVELASRELYPGLNPTSSGHDLGEDARTEPSTEYLLPDGRRVSIAASKTATWGKLQKDCIRCQQTGRNIDILVFVIAGNPQQNTIERWSRQVRQDYGWDLEVRPLRWLAPVASRPQHESFVDDHLNIPPPDGDYVQNIETQFIRHTDQALRKIRLNIPGIVNPLPREEVLHIEDQLQQNKPVLLVGEPGVGKSGIGAILAKSALESGKVVLLLDARRVTRIENEIQLRQHFGLNGPIDDAIKRVGRYKGCRLIIDQLDNTLGFTIAEELINLAVNCCNQAGIDVVVISRARESDEAKLLQPLSDIGFIRLISYELSIDKVAEVLAQLGIVDPSQSVKELGTNLLNLELIGTIKTRQPSFNFSTLMDEVYLWEQYLQVLREREQGGFNPFEAERIIAEAIRLAKIGLTREDRNFEIDYPPVQTQSRLISWGVLVAVEGRMHRFHHEKLQDFLYALDATGRLLMPRDVVNEIGPHRVRNILPWIDKIYAHQRSSRRAQFLREAFNV